MINFTINTDKKSSFPHYWEECVGSCRAYTALREDYRKQLKKAKEELGFKYVRFHGLFNDDMSVCLRKMSFGYPVPGEFVYNFSNIDNIFDFLLSIGMKPFIEIGFMPECLASGKETVFHYKGNITPPADYNLWNDFIHAFIEHLADRYGIEEIRSWFFEVWNEPNLIHFWSGTKEQYFELYENTAKTIKSFDNQLRVGGPATSINAWITDMIEFCEGNNVPLDFISTHHYPTDDPLWKKGSTDMSVLKELFEAGEFGKYERGVIKKMTSKAREEAGKYPLYYTEWNTSAMLNDAQHDESYAATMVAKILADNDGLVDGYAFWTFSDIFEESGQLDGAYHGGFGLMNYYGIPKPVYRCFQLFHEAGKERYEVISGDASATVEAIALSKENGMRVIVYNHNIPDAEIKDEVIKIDISDELHPKKITIQRVDQEHCNPKQYWKDMGSPKYLKADDIEQLYKASELREEEINSLEVLVPSQGMCAIDIKF
ncbi:GH39 family glycosyl hydrolase [Litchfieldia alkalitelluris]|uniref:GH39 family glycosyl hydrolase n=1 Tax=Litchfieldia alkalitelluris TaxID=304268 RepID=UPI0009973DE6|nr:cellulase family glycosylhydrolase [Litchfieldia alkalitelluris]